MRMGEGVAVPDTTAISDEEFSGFQRLLHRITGISLRPEKKALVSGRLARRLRAHGLAGYDEYFALITSGRAPQELQAAIDLLTTNETHFFREPRHFEFLRQHVAADARPGRPYRVWSAACSTGEEPYSIAMVLADCLGDGPWEVVGSDISTRVLEKARVGHYPIERAKNIPQPYLKAYCLKGIGRQKDTFLIDKDLRNRVQFMHLNLNESLPRVGEFDVIFLRNVMIYFSLETKRVVLSRLLPLLKPGGYFIVGHSESLNGIADGLNLVAPATYEKT